MTEGEEDGMSEVASELEIEARHADHMTAMAQYWMRRAQDAERVASVLILAAGGKIVVSQNHLQRANNLIVERENHDYDMTVHFRARVVPTHPMKPDPSQVTRSVLDDYRSFVIDNETRA